MGLLSQSLSQFLKFVRRIFLSNRKLRLFLYNIYNQSEFANLYEHEKMLGDSVRVNTYYRAIQKLVNPGDVVLDLGTGTGILSFLAAQKNPQKIYALDHSGFIEIARDIARQNHLENIEFIQANSRNFKPEVQIDVLLHEQMGDYLFNENMLENILDLKRRVLKPGGRILPGRFELYLEPVSLDETFKSPFIWENRVHGVDFSFLRSRQEALAKYQPAEYRQEWLDGRAVRNFLGEPLPALRFDLNEMDSPGDVPRAVEVSRTVTHPGTLDGFCLYFNVLFDEEVRFDTSPLSPRTHWGNCYFRCETRELGIGDVLSYQLFMPDLLDIKTWQVEEADHLGPGHRAG